MRKPSEYSEYPLGGHNAMILRDVDFSASALTRPYTESSVVGLMKNSI